MKLSEKQKVIAVGCAKMVAVTATILGGLYVLNKYLDKVATPTETA